jgi:DNA replication licensing factor MCM6
MQPTPLLFLTTFPSTEQVRPPEGENAADEQPTIIYPYEDQAALMAQRQDKTSSSDAATSPFSTTLFVDHTNLMNHDLELAEAIQNDFTRFESFLRSGISVFMRDRFPDVPDQPYFCALHNVPHTLPVRMLKTDRIGRLTAVTGTVTRTSEVRPELLVGTFRCNKCGLLAQGIAQQYHYTRPTLCRNPRCQNRSVNEFMLEIKESQFCDWQKLRVQENSDEIPPGSMPRSMDVIVRNEMVERAKAGDKCIFSGSLVVIPDGSALARAGEAPQGASGRIRGSDAATGGGGGVRGLKQLGMRELTYRTCFVASSVIPMEAVARAGSVAGLANLVFGPKQTTDHDPDAQEVAMEFTEAQKMEIMGMKESSKLYDKVSEVELCYSFTLNLLFIHQYYFRWWNPFAPTRLATGRSSGGSC